LTDTVAVDVISTGCSRVSEASRIASITDRASEFVEPGVSVRER
jgi:hypothetical protein